MFRRSKAITLKVKTGDQLGAGTDANVYVTLEDEIGRSTERIKLDKLFYNDLERSKVDRYKVKCPDDFGRVTVMKVTRDTKGLADDWFCDYIHVEDHERAIDEQVRQGGEPRSPPCGVDGLKNTFYNHPALYDYSTQGFKDMHFFPIHRWIAPGVEYVFHEYAVCLPQYDPDTERRNLDLKSKAKAYTYIVRQPGMVAQIENLPSDEKFSEEYYWTFVSEKVNLLTKTKFTEWTTSKWKALKDLRTVYSKSLGEPECFSYWREDWWFGTQRLQGVNPMLITLCKAIPDKLAVTDELLEGLLEGYSIGQAVENRKLFICDLEITNGIPTGKEGVEFPSPIALLYLNKENKLMPVAIQLKQEPGDENPVYTPKDPASTWLVAKMFYNNAEAQHHQALTHLGYTHLLMEGVVICTHRNLSPSHPLFKLMAPHFLFLLAINSRGLEKLVSRGGWVDCCMTQGLDGIFELMRRGFDRWSFMREGQVEKELEARGVLDSEVLPCYPYRDEAVPLYNVIKKYVGAVVRHHYDTPEKLSADWELKWWREELVKPRDQNGVGLKDIPGNLQDGFTSVDDVVDVVTGIISTCSLGHAAANFQQYEQYAFIPNYPGILYGEIPKKKREFSEDDLMAMLPDKKMTLDIMVITKLLSTRGTKSLGDFEMQYLYDPVGVEAAREFKRDLKKLSLDMKKRNVDRQPEFQWLDPEIVPNSISV